MKLLLACTSGGHFATMRAIEAFWQSHERTWITDQKGDTQLLSDRGESVHWLPFQGPRDFGAFFRNLPRVIAIMWQERPDVVVSTGASVAVSVAIAARLLGIRFMFIECISRVTDLSLSGRLVYPLASEFYVQSPQLCERYRRAEFRGIATS